MGKHVLHESTACADYLITQARHGFLACAANMHIAAVTRHIMQGISAGRILKETASYDTVGNGYFAATIHAVPAGWR